MLNMFRVLPEGVRLAGLGVIFAALFFLVSATEERPYPSVLEEAPCEPPCWQRIRPGVTSESNAFRVLDNLEQVVPLSMMLIDDKCTGLLGEVRFELTSGEAAALALKNRIVHEIRLAQGGDLSLRRVVRAFGTPDYVSVHFNTLETRCYEVDLYYISQGITVSSGGCRMRIPRGVAGVRKASVYGGMEVRALAFAVPAPDLPSFLLDSLEYAPEGVQHILSVVHAWNGFGYYTWTQGDMFSPG